MDTSCVKQLDKPKYVVHVLGGVASNKYRQHDLLLQNAFLVRCTRIRRSRVKYIETSSREQKSPTRYSGIVAGLSCHRGDSLKFLFEDLITVGRQQQ